MRPEDYLDAIRLAVAAPTNSRRMVSVIEDILHRAPRGERGHEPVRIFTTSIKNVMPASNTETNPDGPA